MSKKSEVYISKELSEIEAQIQELVKAKKKIEQQEREFLAKADTRKEQLLERWDIVPCTEKQAGVLRAVKKILETYGCSLEEFWAYVGAPQQVSSYKAQNSPKKASV